jgi:hypothetical protein
MGKYIFLGINSLFIVIANFFGGDDVTIKHNIPASVAAGTEFVAEITINKGPANQFGKMQLDLPAGMTGTEMDSKSGKFSYDNNSAKILWIQLPSEQEFTIKIKITVDKDASGPKLVSGKFLYVNGNDKKQVEMNPHEITVTNPNAAATTPTTTTTTATNTTTATTNTTTTAATNTTSATGKDSTFNKPDEPGADVAVKRKITKDPATGNFNVEIKIKKGQVKGFAKYHDVLPAGLTAVKGTSSGGGNFKFVDGKASIIWPTLPKDEEISATYTIKVTGTFTENPKINGAFSYLENEQTLKLNASEETLEIIAPPVIATNTVTPNTNTVTPNTNTVTPETTTVTATNTVTPTNTVVANTSTVTADTKTVTATTDPDKTTTPLTGVNFLVQIGAYKNAPKTDYFTNKFNIADPITTEMQGGLTKFLIGKSFTDYKSSRDYRETVKGKGVTDAFVTAYNGGKRISVQEGLMITSQKWFR